MTAAFARIYSGYNGNTHYLHTKPLSHAQTIENDNADIAAELDSAWEALRLKAEATYQQEGTYMKDVSEGIFKNPAKVKTPYNINWVLEPIGHNIHTNSQGKLVITVSAVCFQQQN